MASFSLKSGKVFFPKNWVSILSQKYSRRFTHSKFFVALIFQKGKSCFTFFSRHFLVGFLFYFFPEKFAATLSLAWKVCFFCRHREKNKLLVYALARFWPKISKKTNFSREKKTVPLSEMRFVEMQMRHFWMKMKLLFVKMNISVCK